MSETKDKNMVAISTVTHINVDHQSLKPRIRTWLQLVQSNMLTQTTNL